jgi:protein required for attachment to host cells
MRSAMEQTDWHAKAEKDFLHDLAGRLDAAISAGDTNSLVMVAPPRALGIIRLAYSAHVRSALRGEVDKDFVKLPVYEIEKQLTGAQ